MMKKILVTGVNGQLGYDVVLELKKGDMKLLVWIEKNGFN